MINFSQRLGLRKFTLFIFVLAIILFFGFMHSPYIKKPQDSSRSEVTPDWKYLVSNVSLLTLSLGIIGVVFTILALNHNATVPLALNTQKSNPPTPKSEDNSQKDNANLALNPNETVPLALNTQKSNPSTPKSEDNSQKNNPNCQPKCSDSFNMYNTKVEPILLLSYSGSIENLYQDDTTMFAKVIQILSRTQLSVREHVFFMFSLAAIHCCFTFIGFVSHHFGFIPLLHTTEFVIYIILFVNIVWFFVFLDILRRLYNWPFRVDLTQKPTQKTKISTFVNKQLGGIPC